MVEDHGKTSAGSSRFDPVTGGVFGEPEHLRAVSEERSAAFGSVEGGSRLERGQVGDEVDRRLPLLTREHPDAREEILIRQARRESKDVRIHASCLSRPISRLGEGPDGNQERRVEAGSARVTPSARLTEIGSDSGLIEVEVSSAALNGPFGVVSSEPSAERSISAIRPFAIVL